MRLNLALWLALLASSFYLVSLRYESRRLFTARERALATASQLAAEYERLLAEQRVLAAPSRVQLLAQRQLRMRPAHPGVTEYVTLAPTQADAGGRP